MDHRDLNDFSWLGERTDADRAERLEQSTNAIDKFFAQCDLQQALRGNGKRMSKAEQTHFVGLAGYEVSERDAEELEHRRGSDSAKMEELGEFLKVTQNEVRAGGMTKQRNGTLNSGGMQKNGRRAGCMKISELTLRELTKAASKDDLRMVMLTLEKILNQADSFCCPHCGGAIHFSAGSQAD
jgi:hypothetical protein